ncbi:MAG TPA: hypothetical protein VGF28_09765 [Thermoanaerobaculia bacterium]|jgi:hypothetical protein
MKHLKLGANAMLMLQGITAREFSKQFGLMGRAISTMIAIKASTFTLHTVPTRMTLHSGIVLALLSVAVRLSVATTLGVITWWSYVTRGASDGLLRILYRVLDWPVATVGQLFPQSWAGIDVFYGTNLCDFCTPRELLLEHLKFAVPVFVLLSYVGTSLRERWRRRLASGSA